MSDYQWELKGLKKVTDFADKEWKDIGSHWEGTLIRAAEEAIVYAYPRTAGIMPVVQKYTSGPDFDAKAHKARLIGEDFTNTFGKSFLGSSILGAVNSRKRKKPHDRAGRAQNPVYKPPPWAIGGIEPMDPVSIVSPGHSRARHTNTPYCITIKMAGYKRRRKMKRSKRRFRKKSHAKNRLYRSLKAAGPIGNVKFALSGRVACLAGQQDFQCLPLSSTQDEFRSMYDNLGPGGRTMGNYVDYVHDLQTQNLSTTAEFTSLSAASTMKMVKKEFLYSFNCFRSYRFKNPANVNVEVVFHLVTCKKDIPLAMYPMLTTSNTHEAITMLCKTQATSISTSVTPLKEYGQDATAAASVEPLNAGITPDIDEKGLEIYDVEQSSTTRGQIGAAFAAWRRIGWTPKEVSSFRQHFKIKKSKKLTLTSNSCIDYKFADKKMHKLDTSRLVAGLDTSRQLHTRKGQQFLVVVVRGFPTVMKWPAAAYTTFSAAQKDAWSYDNGVTDAFTISEQGSAAEKDLVSTSPAALIWVSNCSVSFGSKSFSTGTVRSIESLLPSAYALDTVPCCEVAEDSETVSAYKTAFED